MEDTLILKKYKNCGDGELADNDEVYCSLGLARCNWWTSAN